LTFAEHFSTGLYPGEYGGRNDTDAPASASAIAAA
jgi:hypothetical protein